ncbi:MAG: quinolinate synthase [Phycisphaerae bacterium]
MLYQPELPPKYTQMSDEDLAAAIADRKRQLGRRVIILGHHYQQDDVIRFADFTGDSLKLSQIAAKQKDAEFVIFCGVHFMAESADILTGGRVAVILPDLTAGCSMADMAEIGQVEESWRRLASATDENIIPITYVNSAASIKAFCGARNGACCTSSNASKVLQWALAQGGKVMFLPDQHLGRNAAYGLGWPLDSMVVYDPQADGGGLTDEQIRNAKFILWKGHCSVHQLFTPEQCDKYRAMSNRARSGAGVPPAPDRVGSERGSGLESFPAGTGVAWSPEPWKIIVHPECPWEVVQKADLAGSTEFIIKTIDEAPPGSKWAVGTEINLVTRLANRHAGVKEVRSLAGIQCLCSTMYRIDMPHLLHALDNLAEGRVINRISVDPETRRLALLALDRMLANVSAQPVAIK